MQGCCTALLKQSEWSAQFPPAQLDRSQMDLLNHRYADLLSGWLIVLSRLSWQRSLGEIMVSWQWDHSAGEYLGGLFGLVGASSTVHLIQLWEVYLLLWWVRCHRKVVARLPHLSGNTELLWPSLASAVVQSNVRLAGCCDTCGLFRVFAALYCTSLNDQFVDVSLPCLHLPL